MSTTSTPPDREAAPQPEPLLPDDLTVLFAGTDGHVYLSRGDGKDTTRLTWKPDDFSALGLPPWPGSSGELEDSYVFAHPTPSPDGQRVAVFGLLPTFIDGDDDMLDWGDDESLEEGMAALIERERAEGGLDLDDDTVLPGIIGWPEGQGIDDEAPATAAEVEPVEGDLWTDPDEDDDDDDDGDDDDDSWDNEPRFWAGGKVYVLHSDGVQVWEAWDLDEARPTHIEWSPDGRWLLVLHTAPGALALTAIDPERPGEAMTLAEGAPVFWAWQPGGDRLALRVTDPSTAQAELQLGRPFSDEEATSLGPAGAFYRPAWHPQGERLLYTAPGPDDGERLLEVDASGALLRELHTFRGRGSFQWCPTGDRFALAVAPEGAGPFTELLLWVEGKGIARTLFDEPFVAWQWLLDGGLVLCRLHSDEGLLQWSRVEARSGERRDLGPRFAPSRESAIALHFFEQMLGSHPFLSPRRRYAVVSGHVVDGQAAQGRWSSRGPAQTASGEAQPQVLVTSTQTGRVVSIAEGHHPCFAGPR